MQLPLAAISPTAAAAATPVAAAAVPTAVAIAVAVAAAITITVAVAAAAATTRLLAGLPAGRTAPRFVGEALLRVKLLFARGEHELRATIPARQRFVSVAHRSPLLLRIDHDPL
jgi:hypothetical protein